MSALLLKTDMTRATDGAPGPRGAVGWLSRRMVWLFAGWWRWLDSKLCCFLQQIGFLAQPGRIATLKPSCFEGRHRLFPRSCVALVTYRWWKDSPEPWMLNWRLGRQKYAPDASAIIEDVVVILTANAGCER